MTATYFHGGAPDLEPGDLILPTDETGAPSTASYGAAGVCRRDRVYLASEPGLAIIYAAMHPSDHGGLYEVEPLGEIEPDPDWTGADGMSVATTRARIVRVVDIDGEFVPGTSIADIRSGLLEQFLAVPTNRARTENVVRKRLSTRRPGRNDPCPCGSGRKWKRCCGA